MKCVTEKFILAQKVIPYGFFDLDTNLFYNSFDKEILLMEVSVCVHSLEI